MSFILVIGATVQFTELALRRVSPLLHRILGLYLPLIASNCAVLGVALLNSTQQRTLLSALFYGAGAALGFGIVLTLLIGLRERLADADVPSPFLGPALALLTAVTLSLASFVFTRRPRRLSVPALLSWPVSPWHSRFC